MAINTPLHPWLIVFDSAAIASTDCDSYAGVRPISILTPLHPSLLSAVFGHGITISIMQVGEYIIVGQTCPNGLTSVYDKDVTGDLPAQSVRKAPCLRSTTPTNRSLDRLAVQCLRL